MKPITYLIFVTYLHAKFACSYSMSCGMPLNVEDLCLQSQIVTNYTYVYIGTYFVRPCLFTI